jgi:hypothetical protein
MALVQSNRSTEALDVLLRGVRQSGRAGAVLYNYGLLLERLGEPQRAEAVYKEALLKRASHESPLLSVALS